MAANDRDPRIVAARQALQEGRTDAAAAIADEVLSDTPADVDALEIKALAASESGDDWTAEEALRKAIALAPDRRWPYADLTRLLLKMHRKVDAEAVAGAALAVDDRNPDAHALLGSMLAERELWVDAAAHFERAIALVGNHPQLLTGLGHARMRSGRLDEARSILEAAVKADPAALEPAVYLAEAEERLGHFAAAERQLDVAGQIARKQGTDVDLQRSVLLARMNEPERALALLRHRDDLSGAALLQRGRLYDRLGHYREAWEDWVAGKAQLAERNGRRYQGVQVAEEAKALIAFASRAADHPRAAPRDDVPQPIFIVGFPRSGTTLVEQILASHSAIVAGGELPFGAELSDLFGVEKAATQPDALRDHYLDRSRSYGLFGADGGYFTDKMPDNASWLPLLRVAFPRSPVIYVRRHPLDILASVMAHDMTHGFNSGYRLDDAARHLALVDDLLKNYHKAGVGPTYELRYESLVADQAAETERLMESIGLPMEPAQISFHERDAVSPTPSYAQVREPLNDQSIGRWRNYAAELGPVTSIVAGAVATGGYAG